MNTTPEYYLLKTLTAAKTSLNAQGGITYAILKDVDCSEVYITLLANDGGSGCFGREILPFANIQACLDGVDTAQPIPAKHFRKAFKASRSANNGGFLVAALRQQNLLAPAPDASHQHVLCEDWNAWKTKMLAMASSERYPPTGKAEDPVTVEPKKVKSAGKKKESPAVVEMQQQDSASADAEVDGNACPA